MPANLASVIGTVPEFHAEDNARRPFDPSANDFRFRRLLGERAWSLLPAAIQKRFGSHVKGGQSLVYQGVITRMKFNWVGRILAQLTRLIGTPLPMHQDSEGQPAVVCVTEDEERGGQFWIRQYGRKNGFPQVVHSSKRFDGPTGLEEYIGFGIGMALKLEARQNELLFKSDHYFLQMFNRRLRFPKVFSPGGLTIIHRDLGEGYFAFILQLDNRLFGRMIDQEAIFTDAP